MGREGSECKAFGAAWKQRGEGRVGQGGRVRQGDSRVRQGGRGGDAVSCCGCSCSEGPVGREGGRLNHF